MRCVEYFNISVKIGESRKKVCRCLLHYLIDHTNEDSLQDGTSILNLILLAGKKYELKNSVRNLFHEFVVAQIGQGRRSKTHVQLICPYSEESSIDVAMRCDNNVKSADLIALHEYGAIPKLRKINFWTKLGNDPGPCPYVPDPVNKEDPFDGAKYVAPYIEKLLRNEKDFIDEMNEAFVPKWIVGHSSVQEAKITEKVFIWVRQAIENLSKENPSLSGIFKLSLSGSIGEGCRLKTKKGPCEPESGQVRIGMKIIKRMKNAISGNLRP